MKRNEWRKRIYDKYMSNIFADTHLSKREYILQYKYFKRNYLSYMPKNKNASILELGSGMGQFYYFCLKSGYRRYEGVDLSDENITYIKKKVTPNARIYKIDMLEFLKHCEKDKYDIVILNDVIEHLTKDEIFDLMDGVMKVLKPGGGFIIKTPNMANPIVAAAGRYIGFDHEIGFTEISIREVLRACGYCNIKIKGTDIYVLNPVISIPAKLTAKVVNFILWFFSALYGRTSLKIYEKDILALAYKPSAGECS